MKTKTLNIKERAMNRICSGYHKTTSFIVANYVMLAMFIVYNLAKNKR